MGNPKKPSRPPAAADEELHSSSIRGPRGRPENLYHQPSCPQFQRQALSDVEPRLHLAAWSGQTKVVEYLCKKADVGAAAMDDMGAIHFAAQKGHAEVVQILVNSGVSIKSYNRKAMTALHYAAQGSHLELVKYLTKKGANVNAKNKAGKTPVDLASSDEIRTFLVECQTTSSKGKGVLNGKEKGSEAQPNSSLQENVDNADIEVPYRDEEPENKVDESIKRKSNEDTTKEILPHTKKPRVALNHLLAADDTQEEEE